ncbi:hypothetical protein [Chromohalobacter israelensis]|uniref:hypothetical protein n=1 Tax=Chromohalobacter israelensis TaxID=141390 RepID=UPI000550322A|nr:hypothetical protein [Chromohalobacter israelensis]MDF9432990.1 hypothetical protein [Chromohalobacter israelensis]
MRVKIGNQWHDSREEPICIQVSRGEQQQIAEMDRSMATEGKYAVFPDSWGGDGEAMLRWLSEESASASLDLQRITDDRDGLAATLDEIGRLCPTDYEDRDELFRTLLRIVMNTPPGARARAEASALRRYAMRLHDRHDWRDHLLVEAERLDQQVSQLRNEARST